jgi:hypothetical protein
LEYTGYFKNNERVMGISSFEEISTQNTMHNALLSWPIPSTWSLEDATTVPLSYVMVILYTEFNYK